MAYRSAVNTELLLLIQIDCLTSNLETNKAALVATLDLEPSLYK